MKRNLNEFTDISNKRNKKKAKRDAQLIATELNNSLISEAPRNVDIIQFAEARSFELNAIESALKNATENTGNQRVFQSLPRHLRRRAASHNIKRIPLQFRKKAYWERKNDPNPKLPPQKPKNRKDKRNSGTIIEEYNRRSSRVKWLETHIWHSKRMKMCEKWGYKIAEYPREKGRKIIYKDEKYTCLLHDASYYQCIEINGFVNDIKLLFNSIIDLAIPSITSDRYIKGNKMGNTKIYEFKKYPFNTISPITFLWKPDKNNEIDNRRTLWLWVHPSSCHDLLREIEISKSVQKIDNVHINHMNDEIVMFQLAGPRSHAILQEILNLCDSINCNNNINEKAHKTWKSLKYLRTPASLPAGVVLGLTVYDPRLSNFKKMKKREDEISEENQKLINDICCLWPENVSESDIWDSKLRDQLKNNKCSENLLNKRRSESLVPGTTLEPLETDSKIPILLIQRGATNYMISDNKQSQELLYGWNLLIPKGWAMAFFKPLVFAGARVIGLKNIYELYFESNIPCYPYDYIETKSYKNYINKKAKEEEEIFNRKPLSKRPNYQKLGIMSPFKPPFEAYLSMIKQQYQNNDDSSLWVLNTPKLINLFIEEAKIKSNTVDSLNKKIYSEIIDYYNKHEIFISIDEIKKNNTIINAFIRVSVDILGKGVINDNSIIYLSTKTEYDKWLNSKKKEKNNTSVYNIGEFPSPSSIIGFVTTGHYSLNNAHAKAIGCCSVIGVLNMMHNNIKNNYKHSTFILVRDPKGQVIRPAIINFLS